MKFTETKISGTWLVDMELLHDDRGFFSRAWCEEEFGAHGITKNLSQANLSLSKSAGTIRGMHFRRGSHSEMKSVRCIRGAIFDVVLDLRPDSSTYCQWHGEELSAENRRMLVVPEGCAHGFQTLLDDSEIYYLMSQTYLDGSESGVRWDDPAFDIQWPLPIGEISIRDAAFPDYEV
jgi:dTDP-4-dehydrorhamnose 3,5-epimerase